MKVVICWTMEEAKIMFTNLETNAWIRNYCSTLRYTVRIRILLIFCKSFKFICSGLCNNEGALCDCGGAASDCILPQSIIPFRPLSLRVRECLERVWKGLSFETVFIKMRGNAI